MSEPLNPTEFVGWPEAVRVLGHGLALRAARDDRLTVYQFNGRRLVRRDALNRVRAAAPATRRRGDSPLADLDLGPRR